MRWRVIERVMEQRLGHQARVEGPATADTFLEAPDREAAEALLPKDTLTRRYRVVAECSWRQMTAAERAYWLAGTPLTEKQKQVHTETHRPSLTR